MKVCFTFNQLKDSETFYSPILIDLFYAQYYYYKDAVDTNSPYYRIHTLIEYGSDDFYNIFKAVNAYNKSFISLLEDAEPLSAFPFIRMQLDNLIHIYAETVYPTVILHNIYDKGKALNQIKIKGKSLVQSDFRNELDNSYSNIANIYQKNSGFIHPSKQQIDTDKKILKKYIREFSSDMEYINKVITKVLIAHIKQFKCKTKV